jgi:hypothetical protein
VALPAPVPGLVIGYAYLWRDEARRGVEEGRKDRPAVIVLAVQEKLGETIVTVAPISHRRPNDPEEGIEIPALTKARLGLDEQPSWIIASDLNQFVWPGADLRPTRRGSDEFAYGLVPRTLYLALRQKVLAIARRGRLAVTGRGPA